MSPPSHRKPSQVAREVEHRFQESGHQPLRSLRVEERQGQVIVSGSVPSFYMKQLAQTIAGMVDGVDRVYNQTVVAPAQQDRMRIVA